LFIAGLLLALLLFEVLTGFLTERHAKGERYAEISVDGRVGAVVVLNENGLYTPEGRPAVQIAVRDGAVGFVSSDCPDKTCIHLGFLSRPGQSAVCLPNRVVVRVVARDADDADALDSTTY
jgi:hypothetical protein